MSDENTDNQSKRDDISERLEESADRAVEGFDQRLVDLLAWILETETKARIYIYLRQNQQSTSEEVAEGTGLYPSTVREALAEMADDEIVERSKRSSEGAGNNPYEYSAMAPSDLISSTKGQIQDQLNAVFNLDAYTSSTSEPESDPVTITVEDDTDDESDHTSSEDIISSDSSESEEGEEDDSSPDDSNDEENRE